MSRVLLYWLMIRVLELLFVSATLVFVIAGVDGDNATDVSALADNILWAFLVSSAYYVASLYIFLSLLVVWLAHRLSSSRVALLISSIILPVHWLAYGWILIRQDLGTEYTERFFEASQASVIVGTFVSIVLSFWLASRLAGIQSKSSGFGDDDK